MFMFTAEEPLTYFKFQYSINRNDTRFSHTFVDKLPKLSYSFAAENNWKATDDRVKNKWEEMDEWLKSYWNIRDKNGRRNGDAFEYDLEKFILNAHEAVKQQWKIELEKDFEKEFADPLVKFLRSKD